MSNPAAPVEVGFYTHGSYWVSSVVVAYPYAYLGIGDVVNVSSPTSPALVGSFVSQASVQHMTLDGNYLYVPRGDKGLSITELTDPENPALVTTYNTGGYFMSVARSGDYFYVTNLYRGLLVLRAGASTDITLSNNSVSENQPIGTLVGTFTATAPGDAHTYSFCGGADDASFSISGDQLLTAAVFDFETKNTYDICVRADNGHGGTFDKAFTINVTDVIESNPPTDISLSNNNVTENQPIGTLIGTLTTTDPDAGDTHTYSFCGGADDTSFSISGDQLLTATIFDYETKNAYIICVRTNDGHGGTYDKPFSITVTDIPNVELVAPSNGEDTHTNRPTFQWNAYAGATNYLIQISTLNDFSSKVTKATLAASVTTYTPKKDLFRNTTYYWRVAAKVGGAYTPWSETWSFTTGNPPAVPKLSAPGNNKSVAGPSPLFDWKDIKPIAGVTFDHYEIQISADAIFSTFESGAPTNSQYNGFLLKPGTYYWRVRSVADNGDFSAWSQVRSVTIQ